MLYVYRKLTFFYTKNTVSAVLVKKKKKKKRGWGEMNCRNLPIVCFQNTFQNLWGGMGLIWGFFLFYFILLFFSFFVLFYGTFMYESQTILCFVSFYGSPTSVLLKRDKLRGWGGTRRGGQNRGRRLEGETRAWKSSDGP